MKNKYIIMHEEDNCATSLDVINEGDEINVKDNKIIILSNIPLGHKFSLVDISKGDFVKKYGQIIGITTEDIKRGDWIHTHNLKSHYLEGK
ncbi:MAG: UxaA family hydrolase [Promethearchaeota archaeon]